VFEMEDFPSRPTATPIATRTPVPPTRTPTPLGAGDCCECPNANCQAPIAGVCPTPCVIVYGASCQ
jgi:hypothetical protein